MIKKIISLILAPILVFAVGITALAEGVTEDRVLELPYCPVGEVILVPVDDAEYIDDGAGNIIKISDLMSFASKEDADRYIVQLEEELSSVTRYNPSIQWGARSTHGDAIVASQQIGIAGTIKLGVVYTTSGDASTGDITYHEAYTTFSGFTLGYGWDETLCSSQVTSSGKDIYAIAKGELTFNLLVDGFIEFGRKSLTLDGYCYAVR